MSLNRQQNEQRSACTDLIARKDLLTESTFIRQEQEFGQEISVPCDIGSAGCCS